MAFEMYCIGLVICASFALWLLSEYAVFFEDMQKVWLARNGLRCVALYWAGTIISCVGCKLMWPDSVCPNPLVGITYSYNCPDPYKYVQAVWLQACIILVGFSILFYLVCHGIEWINSPDEPLVRVHLKNNSV